MKRLDKKAGKWILPGIFTAALLILHAFVQPDFGDDLTYADVYWDQNLLAFLKDRYEWWSSRVVIEAVMMPLTVADPWVWRILNTLMTVLLVWNTADLFGLPEEGEKAQAQCIFFALMWTVPLASLCSAGWITTTTNYLWPLALGTVALRPLKRWLLGQDCHLSELVFCPLCALYAANMEQTAAILLGVYLAVGVYLFVKKRRLPLFYFVMLALIGLSLWAILASPGNANRNATETERFFPEFWELSGPQKLEMGFIESAHYYVAAGHKQVSYLFGALTGVLGLAMAGRARQGKGHPLQLPVALCPLLFYWGVGHLARYLLYGGVLTRGLNLVGLFGENRQLGGLGNYSAGLVLLQAAVYLCLLGCVALTVFFLHGRSEETLFELLILGAGFTSRVLVGFSPTIYASGDRTALFASAAILIVTLRNIQLYLRTGPRAAAKAALWVYLAVIIRCNLGSM